MASVQEEVTAPHKPSGDDRDALQSKLDQLFRHYLDLLHQYTSSRETLNQELSSGFISIAQANFQNPLRARYGQDFYDERMKAITQVKTQSDPLSVSMSAMNISSQGDDNESTDQTHHRDPLRWFGVLTPPALKASQHHFKDAVNDIARIASLSAQMREVEIEVRRTRKKISKFR